MSINIITLQWRQMKTKRKQRNKAQQTCESPWKVDRSTDRQSLDKQRSALRNGGYHIPCKSAGESKIANLKIKFENKQTNFYLQGLSSIQQQTIKPSS